jgi:hypothetical protein
MNVLNKYKKTNELELRITNFTLPNKIKLTDSHIRDIQVSGIIDKKIKANKKYYVYNFMNKRFTVDIDKNTTVCDYKKRVSEQKYTYHKLVLSKEEPKKCKRKIDTDKKLDYIKLKFRESFLSKKFPDWRFDFTKVFIYWKKVGNTKSINEVKKILKSKTIKNMNFDNEFEIEYIGKKFNIKQVEQDVNFFNDFININFGLMSWILKELKVKTSFQIMNNVLSLDKNRFNILKKNKKNYAVSEKKDGERFLLYIGTKWTYLIDKSFEIMFHSKNDTNTTFTLLDIEKIDDKIIVFDILIYKNKNVTVQNFKNRLKYMGLIKNITLANFYIPSFQKSLGVLSKMVYTKKYDYDIDGLIFTPLMSNYRSGKIFKWKPNNLITIDFLVLDVRKKKDELCGNLYISISRKNYMKQYGTTILSKYKKKFNLTGREKFFPMLFDPPNSKKEPYWKFKIKTKLPIKNEDIVEFARIDNKWEALRIRHDKTKRYKRGKKVNIFMGPNGTTAAYNNWNIINNPVLLKSLYSL